MSITITAGQVSGKDSVAGVPVVGQTPMSDLHTTKTARSHNNAASPTHYEVDKRLANFTNKTQKALEVAAQEIQLNFKTHSDAAN